MSYIIPQGFCPSILGHLKFLTGIDADPSMANNNTGMLDGLLSPPNRSMVSPMWLNTVSGRGHIQNMDVFWRQRSTRFETYDQFTCDPGPETNRNQKTITIGDYSGISVSLPLNKVQRYCDDASRTVMLPNSVPPTEIMSEVLDVIMSKLPGLRDTINYKSLIAVGPYIREPNAPGYPAGFEPINMLNANGDKLPSSIQRIMADRAKTQMGRQPPIAVGAGVSFDWFNSLGFSCCSTSGFDWNKVSASQPLLFHLDDSVEAVFGPNHFFFWQPGALQFVAYNRNTGSFAGDFGTATLFTLPDPMYPAALKYDARVTISPCGEDGMPVLEISIGLNHGIAPLPEESYSPSDSLYGWQGIAGKIAVQTP